MNYKNKIKNYRPEVDMEAWAAMEKLLDKQDVNYNDSNRKEKRQLGIRKVVFILVIGAILASLIFFFFSRNIVTNSESFNSSSSMFLETNQQLIHLENKSEDNSSGSLITGSSEDSSAVNIVREADVHSDLSANKTSANTAGFYNQLTIGTEERKVDESVSDNFKLKNENSSDGTVITKSEHLENTSDPTSSQGKALGEDGEKQMLAIRIGQSNNNALEYSSQNTSSKVPSNRRVSDSKSNEDKLILDGNTTDNAFIQIEKLTSLSLNAIEQSAKASFNGPEFIIPSRAPSRYLLGLDIGNANYLDLMSGESISLLGVYSFYPWLRSGFRLNRTNLRKSVQFTIMPEIKEKRFETRVELFTQIVPIRIWKFNLGADIGIGTTYLKNINRKLENPEPNVLNVTQEINNSTNTWFYLGAHFTVDITSTFKIGTTVGSNMGTESLHWSGRLMYNL